MRTLTVLATACLMIGLAAAPTASAHTFSDSQQLLVALGPVTWGDVGITWTAAACDPSSPLNGIDGFWYDVSGFGGHKFLLTSADPMDVDVLTFTSSCELILWNGACFIETGVELPVLGNCQQESGLIEANAAFVLVLNWVGAGTYDLQFTH